MLPTNRDEALSASRPHCALGGRSDSARTGKLGHGDDWTEHHSLGDCSHYSSALTWSDLVGVSWSTT